MAASPQYYSGNRLASYRSEQSTSQPTSLSSLFLKKGRHSTTRLQKAPNLLHAASYFALSKFSPQAQVPGPACAGLSDPGASRPACLIIRESHKKRISADESDHQG